MITSKNNFKGYLRKHYPDVASYPVYGQPIYILDKPLSDIDNYNYNIQQLPNGKYVAFVGISISEATRLLTELRNNGVPRNSRVTEKRTAPTTFSCFEAWLERHGIVPTNRTFCNNMSPVDCLHSEQIAGLPTDKEGNILSINKRGVWYMYELPIEADDGIRFSNIPHIVATNIDGNNVLITLIKASASRYKSKKQRFIEKFQFMQPIYEKLIASCAVAEQHDQVREYSEAEMKWNEAKHLCEQYMNTQFETEGGYIDVDEMKEAFRNGSLGLYTRNPDKLYKSDSEETF